MGTWGESKPFSPFIQIYISQIPQLNPEMFPCKSWFLYSQLMFWLCCGEHKERKQRAYEIFAQDFCAVVDIWGVNASLCSQLWMSTWLSKPTQDERSFYLISFSAFRLFGELCNGDRNAILPWTTKVQSHCRSEDVWEALHARVEDVLKSCLHMW